MESDVINMSPQALSRLRELITLISASGGQKLLETMVADNSAAHPVNPERLWRILDKLNLSSLLYSPLNTMSDSSGSVHAARTSGSYLDEVRMRRFGSGFRNRDFVMCLKSLSHKWSVCGHRYVDSDSALVPCPVYCSILDSKGQFVISGADDHLIKIWDVRTGLLKASLFGHHAEVCEVALSPCDEYLASLCSEDSTVFVWRRSAEGVYTCLHKLVEIDPVEVSRRLTPLYMSFYPSKPTPSNPLKLVIAYTNGTVVISEVSVSRGSLLPFNQIFSPLGPTYELRSFSVIQPNPQTEAHVVHLLVGLNKPGGTEKFVYGFSVRKRTPPAFLPHTFPSSIKSPITQIAVAHNSWSFVASDDEVSTVVFFKQSETSPTEFARIVLFKSLVSGGAHLAEGFPLFARMEEIVFGRVTNQINRSLKVTVDVSVFAERDEFIFCTIACLSGEDSGMAVENGNCFCCLVFDGISGKLVNVLGLGDTKSNIFNVVNVSVPLSFCSCVIATASHDGQLVIYSVSKSCVERITAFNINTRGSNTDRSILDCSLVCSPEGDLICVVSDSLGTLSLFAALPWHAAPPAEQFLPLDYLPEGVDPMTGTRTSIAMPDTLCDARLVPLSGLEIPTPACLGPASITGTGYQARWGEGDFISFFASKEIEKSQTELAPPLPPTPNRGGRGRPPLTDDERIRRAAALQALAATRTVRPEPLMHEDQLELYQNSEIDDTDFSSSDDSDSPRRKRRTKPRPVRIVAVPTKYMLTCSTCGAVREVPQNVHAEYIENQKRVKCRWIGFQCDEDLHVPSSSSVPEPPRKKRLTLTLSPERPLRSRASRDESSESESLEEEAIPTRRSTRNNNTRRWI